MIYLDSNIFILATLEEKGDGEKAREILKLIYNKNKAFATSSLTFDEILWIITKQRSKEEAIIASRAILKMPKLKIISVDKNIIAESINIMEETSLRPREAIHLAAMKSQGINEIITEDSDFEKIEGIKRYNIDSFLK